MREGARLGADEHLLQARPAAEEGFVRRKLGERLAERLGGALYERGGDGAAWWSKVGHPRLWARGELSRPRRACTLPSWRSGSRYERAEPSGDPGRPIWRRHLRGQAAFSTSGGAIEAVVQTKEAEEAGHLAVHIELQPLVHQHVQRRAAAAVPTATAAVRRAAAAPAAGRARVERRRLAHQIRSTTQLNHGAGGRLNSGGCRGGRKGWAAGSAAAEAPASRRGRRAAAAAHARARARCPRARSRCERDWSEAGHMARPTVDAVVLFNVRCRARAASGAGGADLGAAPGGCK